MEDLGNQPAGTTMYVPFNTYDANGALVTLTSGASSDIEIYKNGSTTQRASDNGYTFTVDFDSTTGLHMLVIDLSDNSDAGFFSAGASYTMHVGPFTVATQTVGLSYRFRIVAAENTAGTPAVDTVRVGGTSQTAGDIYGKISPSTFPSGTLSTLTQTQVTGGAYSLQTDASGYIKVSSGTGTGQLSVTSGILSVNTTQWGGTAVASALVRSNLIQVGGSATPVTNMGIVFDTDFATNYDTTNDRWSVLTRKIYDSNGFDYYEMQGGADGTFNVAGFGASALQQISEQVWAVNTSSYPAAGTFGGVVGTNLDAAISSRLASASYTAPLSAAGTRSAIGMASANLDTQIGTLATSTALGTVGTNLSGFIATMPTDWISALGVSAAAAEKIEDIARRRTNANVEASSFGDPLSIGSPYGLIQFAQEQTIVGTTGTIYKTDGTTSLGTKTYETDPAAEPITRVS